MKNVIHNKDYFVQNIHISYLFRHFKNLKCYLYCIQVYSIHDVFSWPGIYEAMRSYNGFPYQKKQQDSTHNAATIK